MSRRKPCENKGNNRDNYPPTMVTPDEVPIREAPASIMAFAVSASRMPPDAFTPQNWLTVSRISLTC